MKTDTAVLVKDNAVVEALKAVLTDVKATSGMKFDEFVKRVEALSGRRVDPKTKRQWFRMLDEKGWIARGFEEF